MAAWNGSSVHAKPPAAPYPVSSSVADEDSTAVSRGRSIQYLRKRRCALWCCGCCGAIAVVLGITVLILALTVFKVKDPILTMNSLSLAGVDLGAGNLSANSDIVLLNATLVADISIKNPNVASFKFNNSTTEFYYRGGGGTVGVAYAPAGEAGAHRTARMNVTVDVLTNSVARKMNVTTGMLIGGAALNLTSYTDVSGRVKVLGIYKRNLDVMLNCSITMEVSLTHQEIKSTQCAATVQ